ncbi:hypothetical protein BDP27DRAFT_1218444 [Rhodocollybia butyracea]|uniref:Uncharacterized protein n=1 Tax=Rhodocollybia butyracea TaxID=206335 RepID=A0A9P5PZE5_9AGAR|nr:hypothetical protein BDP27DRAFT_1218444 [Rhodocollybia butyracea]
MEPNNLPRVYKMSLEEQFYNLDVEEHEFFKRETGIEDEEELKKHIIAVQTKAYSIYRYPCIRIFEFARLKIARLPAYSNLLKLGKERKHPVFLDLGCCCWYYIENDTRKAIQDGYPSESVLATDLHVDFWQLGHEMFRSSQQSFPVPFLQGNILDKSFLDIHPPFTKGSPPSSPLPVLGTLTSLNPLRGHVDACYIAAVFHLFNEEGQTAIAEKLAGLLSPEPGSMIFGVHGSRSDSEKGFWHPTGSERYMFCHSPDSWKDLWEGLFGKGSVEVKAQLRKEIGGDDFFGTYPGNKDPNHVMEWSVTRI